MRSQPIQAHEIEGWPSDDNWLPGLAIIPRTEAEAKQLDVLVRALRVYADRNQRYHDNWKRMGWRGVLIRIRERSERLWDEFWGEDRPVVDTGATVIGHNADDALDLINFAAFMVRALEDGEATRDGSWWS